MEVTGQLHAPTALRGRTEPRPRLNRNEWATEPVLETLEEKKNSLLGIEARFLWRPAFSLIAEQSLLARLVFVE
jgi:hypothetical protein